MSTQKKESKKVKCEECGNTTQFHSYGECSVDIIHKWDKKRKKYISTPTSYYIHTQGQFSCAKCGEDNDDIWDDSTWEGDFQSNRVKIDGSLKITARGFDCKPLKKILGSLLPPNNLIIREEQK